MDQKLKTNGVGYGGPNSTRPTQSQEGDLATEGGARSSNVENIATAAQIRAA